MAPPCLRTARPADTGRPAAHRQVHRGQHEMRAPCRAGPENARWTRPRVAASQRNPSSASPAPRAALPQGPPQHAPIHRSSASQSDPASVDQRGHAPPRPLSVASTRCHAQPVTRGAEGNRPAFRAARRGQGARDRRPSRSGAGRRALGSPPQPLQDGRALAHRIWLRSARAWNVPRRSPSRAPPSSLGRPGTRRSQPSRAPARSSRRPSAAPRGRPCRAPGRYALLPTRQFGVVAGPLRHARCGVEQHRGISAARAPSSAVAAERARSRGPAAAEPADPGVTRLPPAPVGVAVHGRRVSVTVRVERRRSGSAQIGRPVSTARCRGSPFCRGRRASLVPSASPARRGPRSRSCRR